MNLTEAFVFGTTSGEYVDTGPVIGAAFDATLAAARDSDEAAFTCLFRDIQPALLRYLRVLAPGAADDVAGETWLQVVGALPGFSGGEAAFRAWLFTIARHRAVDWGRRRGRRATVPLVPEEPGERLTAPDAAEVALERMSTRTVLALIATLPSGSGGDHPAARGGGPRHQGRGQDRRQDAGRGPGGSAPGPAAAG